MVWELFEIAGCMEWSEMAPESRFRKVGITHLESPPSVQPPETIKAYLKY